MRDREFHVFASSRFRLNLLFRLIVVAFALRRKRAVGCASRRCNSARRCNNFGRQGSRDWNVLRDRFSIRSQTLYSRFVRRFADTRCIFNAALAICATDSFSRSLCFRIIDTSAARNITAWKERDVDFGKRASLSWPANCASGRLFPGETRRSTSAVVVRF